MTRKLFRSFLTVPLNLFFSTTTEISLNLVHLAELLEQFGWELAGELVCSLGAKILGQGRGRPGELHREAIQKMKEIDPIFDELPQDTSADYDENKFSAALVSGDLDEVFDAVTEALTAGNPY